MSDGGQHVFGGTGGRPTVPRRRMGTVIEGELLTVGIKYSSLGVFIGRRGPWL